MALKPRLKQTDKLAGTRILVAEDEILIALDIESMLLDSGAEVLGPCTTIAKALQVVQKEMLSGATLDVRLGPVTTAAIASALTARNIPFVFYTGNVLPNDMRQMWPDAPVITKPAEQSVLVDALTALLRT